MRKVSFFIAGVQKGGTTALDGYLRRHTQIQMARIKEVHHFDDETHVDWADPRHDRLHNQFDWDADDVVRGEATPIYTYWPQSISRLQQYNPNAKLLVTLRHPVYRAYSHWKMETKRKQDHLAFEDAFAARHRVANAPGGVHRVFSYADRGFYKIQVERVLAHFPRSQVMFMKVDDLWTDPQRVLAGIETFLTVRPEFDSVERTYTVPVETRSMGAVPRPVFERLASLYHDDIAATANLTGLNLSDWLDNEFVEPMDAASVGLQVSVIE